VLRRLGDDPTALPSSLVLVTGPSRTGDIEQILTIGAHGPTALHVIVVT
jgi:L-lactate dehydrogenase complex protein LldG